MNRDMLYRKSHCQHYADVISDARDVIGQALKAANGGNVAVAVSGGKDSVAMCHLVAQHCRPLIIYNDSGLEMPESIQVVQALGERLGLSVAIARGDAVGLLRAGQDSNRAIVDPVRRMLRERQIELEFVGLRRAESSARRMAIDKLGPVHLSRRWGCLIAWPMRAWSSADAFAYLDEHQLPVHPAYLRAIGVDRDRIRTSWAYDPDRHAYGDVEWLRRFYPRLFQRLRNIGVIR